MKFKVELDCGNDAFSYDPYQEVGRILETLSDSLNEGARPDKVNLYDFNGNRVGYAEFIEE